MQLELRDLSYQYEDLGNRVKVLRQVNLKINQGDFIAIIGQSGSGKSTLLLQLNGLLKPTSGAVLCDGQNINAKGFNIKRLRQKIGFVFQFPETNLFGQTVYEDVAYAPQNYGQQGRQLEETVDWALEQVGLESSLKDRLPFQLSGGEKRRVAVAGILALKPEVLLLDEPTVGLDPRARENFLSLLGKLNKQGMTVVVVSHELDEVARVAKRVAVIAAGKVAADGTVRKILAGTDLPKWGLETPEVVSIGKRLGLLTNGRPILTEDELIDALLAKEGKRFV
ncbi:MAG TPA: ATP-binding cassette domain-containing protein [Desulfobacteria bacterium]|nr:ATP-binding cassette domain-containing protein [Desulfobacteria bacterium]